MMTAGEYYVGDLCYVMSDEEWEEVCRLTIVGQKCISGEFTMADGRRFAMYNTRWGDGIYQDKNYKKYSVDSGTIGCIKVEDIKYDKYGERLDTLGNIYKFDFDFVSSVNEGLIQFGRVLIDTDPEYNDFEVEV